MRPGVCKYHCACANITVPVQMLSCAKGALHVRMPPCLRKRRCARVKRRCARAKVTMRVQTLPCLCKYHFARARAAPCTPRLHRAFATPPSPEHPQNTPLPPSNHRPAFYLFTSIINKSPLRFFINRQTLERVKAVTRAAPDFRGGGGGGPVTPPLCSAPFAPASALPASPASPTASQPLALGLPRNQALPSYV